MTLSEIEKQVKEFSDARKVLRDRVEVLEEGIRALKKRYLPGIRTAVENAKEKQANLKASVEQGRELFVKPKTLTLFGIKFGLEKQKGKMEWEDKDNVVKLVKKYYPDEWEIYVKTEYKPIKGALAQLASAELKKLGIQITDTGDAVIIKPTDSEVDKLVDALLDEKAESGEDAEAA